MDFFYYLVYYFALFLIPFVIYSLLLNENYEYGRYNGRSKKFLGKDGFSTIGSMFSDWFYPFKLYYAKREVKRYQTIYEKLLISTNNIFEGNVDITDENHSFSQSIFGVDQIGNRFSLKFEIRHKSVAEVDLCLRLRNGNCYIFPGNDHIRQCKVSKPYWKINGLHIEMLEPLKRFRIVFNGLLQNIAIEKYEKIEHVQFNFIYNASGSPTYVPHGMDTNLLAEALVRENWRDNSCHLKHCLIDQAGYEQFGALQGFVKGDSYPQEYVVNLASVLIKQKGIDDRFILNRDLKIFMADTYGNLIYVVIKCFKYGCSQMNYGSAILSNNVILPISGMDILSKNVGQYESVPEKIILKIQVKSKLFMCVIHINKSSTVLLRNTEENGYICYNIPAECDINKNQGCAILKFCYRKEGDKKLEVNDLLCSKIVDILPNTIVSNIKSEDSKLLELTGGKGNSLALLAARDSDDYTIPDGFIITVNAFKQQIESSSTLLKKLSLLNDISCGRKTGNLKDICSETVDYFKKEKILPHIMTAICKELNNIKLCFKKDDTVAWAVRSSAIGEDSDQLSAAGQNDTFLGCLTLDQVLNSVTACWASLFAFQSVQYRREHGMPVFTQIAVVVQNMVPADAAGVLFTCHPSTCNLSQMVLTANFGLGESVVSGRSEPDTFIINRTWDDKVCIIDSKLGNKNDFVQMTNTGIKEIQREREAIHCKEWCITDAQVLHLCKIGVQLEKDFGSPRDIEFAFYQEKLYLLQSRPITTLNSWSEFELTHEMDYPILSDKLVFSVANVGEVFPNSMTVLTQTSTVSVIDRGIQEHSHRHYDPLVSKAICSHQHRAMLEIITTIHRNVQSEVKIPSIIMDLAIFGHTVLDERIHKIAVERLGVSSTFDQLLVALQITNLARKNFKMYNKIKEDARRFKINITDKDSLLNCHKKITDGFQQMHKFALYHTYTGSVCVFYEIIAMTVLCGGSKELTMEHYSDFALILSSCEDVISAEIPKYLNKMSKSICSEGNGKKFCMVEPKCGVTWLKIKCPKTYKLFEEFLECHGHRSLAEFEVATETWAENPSKVIPMIQANVKYGGSITKGNCSIDEMVNKLVSPRNIIVRYILKFLTKKIRSAVGLRELSKSELVRSFSVLKQAYRELARRMVIEGHLISSDLLYHLTHYEIGEVIQNKNPSLIRKAVKRQMLYTKWCKIKFPEIMFGMPIPEKEDECHIDSAALVCIGTPVCTGFVKGRACVISSLDEIDQLQRGDILITYSTDIGWSPYFPMLSGIVTELGGLISHGAVIAREYGLPCIVGVRKATKTFKTGDMVTLSATTGKLGKN